MKLNPLSDRIVVKAHEAEEKTASGIILPDTAKEKPQMGDILAVGPGKVNEGFIEPLQRDQNIKELTENLIICPPSEMIDKLGLYSDVGIDEIIINASFGQSQEDLIESMYRINDKVMPHFKKIKNRVA